MENADAMQNAKCKIVGKNVRAKSLHQFIKDHPEFKGVRISMKGFQEQDWMTNIPLYAINQYFEQK